MNNDVVKIAIIKNVRIKNKDDDYIFPLQNIIKIDFLNGKSRTIDPLGCKDITDVDFLEVLETKKTKQKIIFKDELFEGVEL